MKSNCAPASARPALFCLSWPNMRARRQAADQGTVKEACGLAWLAGWFFSERLHPPVIGANHVYEKLFGQHWLRSTIDMGATCCQRQVDMARRLAENGATEQQRAELSGHSDLFGPACTYRVVCDAKVGTKAHVEQLDAMHHEARVDGNGEPWCESIPRDKR